MANKNNEKKGKTREAIIILILLIIIIILLHFCRFGEIVNTDSSPTGNIDIFDIDINYNIDINDIPSNKIEDIKNKDTYFGVSFDSNGEKLALYNVKKDKNTLGVSFVNGEEGKYIFQQRLNIFSNAAYKNTNKIAPGVSNSYDFIIRNSNNINLRYVIEIYEELDYNINLKYRLKCGDKFILGNETDWLNADNLKTEFKNLEKGASDKYSLEWKWFDDNKNDTYIGKNMESEYKLNIRLFFEAVN